MVHVVTKTWRMAMLNGTPTINAWSGMNFLGWNGRIYIHRFRINQVATTVTWMNRTIFELRTLYPFIRHKHARIVEIKKRIATSSPNYAASTLEFLVLCRPSSFQTYDMKESGDIGKLNHEDVALRWQWPLLARRYMKCMSVNSALIEWTAITNENLWQQSTF